MNLEPGGSEDQASLGQTSLRVPENSSNEASPAPVTTRRAWPPAKSDGRRNRRDQRPCPARAHALRRRRSWGPELPL